MALGYKGLTDSADAALLAQTNDAAFVLSMRNLVNLEQEDAKASKLFLWFKHTLLCIPREVTVSPRDLKRLIRIAGHEPPADWPDDLPRRMPLDKLMRLVDAAEQAGAVMAER